MASIKRLRLKGYRSISGWLEVNFPANQPIVLLGDCQTIGGYPKIAHVITVDLAPAAQLRPNDAVRFEEVTPAAAAALFAEREKDLQRFRVGLALRSA